MSLGIIEESNAQYHASDAISHSKLEVFNRRPELFRRRFIEKSIGAEEGDHFSFGSALHAAVLEPEKFADQYVTQPDEIKGRRGKDWDAFRVGVGDRTILRRSDMEEIDTLAAAVAGNPYAADLISASGSIRESSIRTGDTQYGFAMQCRPDVFNPEGCEFTGGYSYLADVKTVASYDRFQKQFYDLGYYRQLPFYVETMRRAIGFAPQRLFFIVIEKAQPHGCTVLEMDGLAIREGTRETEESLTKLGRAFADNAWPNLPPQGYIGLPDWVVRGMDFAMQEGGEQ